MSIRFLAGVALAAVAARALTALATARATGIGVADLALLGDGHLYLLIAHHLTPLYRGAADSFPLLPSDGFLAGWMPGYPLAIAAVAAVVRDLRWAALMASMAAAAVAAVATWRVAEETTGRAGAASLGIAIWPPVWLLTSSLAFAESLLVALTVTAFAALLRDRSALASVCAGAATVTQKAGILVPMILFLAALSRDRRVGWRAIGALAASYLPLAAFQLYLGFAFGDPLLNFHVLHGIFGGSFDIPFLSLVRGFLHPGELFVLRRPWVAANVFFYGGAAVLAWRHRRRGGLLLLLWIAVPLLFFASLGGPWPYVNFGRFMTIAAPAAICAWVTALPPWQRRRGSATVLALVTLALSVALAAHEARAAARLMERAYPPGYFETFRRTVLGEPRQGDRQLGPGLTGQR